MMTARKRPRPEETLEAECPFVVLHPHPPSSEKEKKNKRRKQSIDDIPSAKVPLQISPFTPLGKFRNGGNSLDRHFQVQPHREWTDMTRYNSFVLNGIKYFNEGFIFIANDATVDPAQKKTKTKPAEKSSQCSLRRDDDWVAKILEIRASDEHHVYARVYWMYWPDELPPGTLEGRRVVQGRQGYHGKNELIASNHMDVINVVSVTAQAKVNQWDETDEDEVQSALYWRQALDAGTLELTPALPRCKCQRPENPDKQLVNCTNTKCKQWLHDECLIDDVLTRTFARLGTDKPHPKGARAKPSRLSGSPVRPEDGMTPLGNGTPEPRRGRGRKNEKKPYEGLFEAVTLIERDPPVFEIRDLRKGVSGGAKTWTEPVYCLLCGTNIV